MCHRIGSHYFIFAYSEIFTELKKEIGMCLICVEFNKKRMTRAEVKKALPEMVMFAKTEEERTHLKKLQALGDSLDEKELQKFTETYVSHYEKKTS